MQGFVLDPEGLYTIADQLRSGLHKHLLRVSDLFRQWDDNADGEVCCAPCADFRRLARATHSHATRELQPCVGVNRPLRSCHA